MPIWLPTTLNRPALLEARQRAQEFAEDSKPPILQQHRPTTEQLAARFFQRLMGHAAFHAAKGFLVLDFIG